MMGFYAGQIVKLSARACLKKTSEGVEEFKHFRELLSTGQHFA